MHRIVRRTATVVTTQTWTVTWTEDDPAAEAASTEPAGPTAEPAQLPDPASPAAPDAPAPGDDALA